MSVRSTSLRDRLAARLGLRQVLDGSSSILIAGLMVALGVVYASTATWSLDQNVDALAAARPGWAIVNDGTVALDDHADGNPWFVEAQGHVVSNRPPGLIAVASAAYLVARPFTSAYVGWPPTLVAVLATAAAVALVAALVSRVAGPGRGLLGAVLIGLGTATWGISADQLWPHGVGQLAMALALVALAGRRHGLAGCALGAGVLLRPQLLVVGAVFVAWTAVADGRRRAAAIGLPIGASLALFLAWNRVVFGTWSIFAGRADHAAHLFRPGDGLSLLENALGTLFDPQNGLLIWSPWLLVAGLGLRAAWRPAPPWMRAGVVAAVAYMLAHASLNRFSGGLAFNYRYPLEAIALAGPMLVLAASAVVDRWWGRRALVCLTAWSVLAQVLYIGGLDCAPASQSAVSCSISVASPASSQVSPS